ncbi:MAG TPA: hypothetical protein VF230_01515 [Acidimicrobiales bacterium]
MRRALRWFFVDPSTGRVVIAQFPNVALWLFIAACAVRRFADPSGKARAVVSAVATAALAWWAIDECLRGVNPFRRLLGAVVLASVAVGLATRVL